MELSVSDIREAYEIASGIAETRIEFCLANAQRKAKKIIGTDQYNDAFDDTPDDADRAADVSEAVIKLTMAEVIVNANLRIRASGQVIQEQDAGSPALGSGSQVVNKFLTPEQVDAFRDRLVNDAMDLLRPYSLTGQVSGMGTLVIGSPAY